MVINRNTIFWSIVASLFVSVVTLQIIYLLDSSDKMIDDSLVGMTEPRVYEKLGKPDEIEVTTIARTETPSGFPLGVSQDYIDKMNQSTVSYLYRYGNKYVVFNIYDKVMAVKSIDEPIGGYQ